MKRLALAATIVAIWVSATPLTAAHRQYVDCRIVHPGYYHQSQGRRAHGKYRVGHFTRYHTQRFNRYDQRFRYDDRRYDDRRYDGRYRYDDRYRYDRRGYYPYRVYPPNHRHRGHRPRVGIYLEF